MEKIDLHKQALWLARQHKKLEAEIIKILQEIDAKKVFRDHGYSSLFDYTRRALGFTEAVSYEFITVARKASDIPALLEAIESGELTTLTAMIEDYLKRHDPLEKAKRATERREKSKKLGVRRVQSEFNDEPKIKSSIDSVLEGKRQNQRRPLNAEVKHQVVLMDSNQCAFEESDGKRCGSERWLEVHHIRPVSHGGTNDPANLKTLCSGHHKLLHHQQLVF